LPATPVTAHVILSGNYDDRKRIKNYSDGEWARSNPKDGDIFLRASEK
jgi:hypothetical protein